MLSILPGWPMEVSINASTAKVSSDTIAFKILRKNVLEIRIVLVACTLTSVLSGWSFPQMWRWWCVHQSWILLFNRLFENSLRSFNTYLPWRVSQGTAKTRQSEISRYVLNTSIHTHAISRHRVMGEEMVG